MYKESGDLLNILGMVGIALLTVMIPIAVSIFREKSDLDRHVILEYVIEARALSCYLGLIYAPILLWAWLSPSFIFQVIFLILWGAGVFYMLGILKKSYRWMKGETVELKSECLQKLNDLKDLKNMEILWRSLWATEKIPSWQERKFFIIFSDAVDELLKGDIEKIRVGGELANDFNSFIDKRSVIFLIISKEFFPKILEWRFSVWETGYQIVGKKDNTGWEDYNGLSMFLSFIFSKVQERALKENKSYSFFITFKPHVEKHKKDFVKSEQGGNNYYLEAVMSDFFYALVKGIEKSIENRQDINRQDIIWKHFPSEWKITSENIKNQENYICIELRKIFLDWAGNRISFSNKSKYDFVLDNLVINLFPSACSFMWADILIFLMRGWENNNRMKSLIEKPRNFGGVEYINFERTGDDEELERKMAENMGRQAEEEETISLALFRFGGNFTQDNLKNYIAELETLKSTHDSKRDMEYRRRRYIRIFKMLLEARREKDAEK